MFGIVYRCTNCRFSFSSGWSHHVGGQLLLCSTCGAEYVLGGGCSCWGARDGERLQLLADLGESLVSTGLSAVVTVPKPDLHQEWGGVSRLQFEDVPCPGCWRSNVLMQSLADGSACPDCETGAMFQDGTCIY